MCDGPHVGKVRSRDPPWYPLTLGMTHVVAALSPFKPPPPLHSIPSSTQTPVTTIHVLSHSHHHLASSSSRSLSKVVRCAVMVRSCFLQSPVKGAKPVLWVVLSQPALPLNYGIWCLVQSGCLVKTIPTECFKLHGIY